ncbi:MAG: class I SAM-dependent methyltransferase [Opitutales bacterium]|nr:class I SAM-dependent methyltransferase [Opitutales bacterium]
MPRISNIVFTAKMLTPEKVKGRRIIDVGSCDFNGSIRPLLESYSPVEYMGIDVLEGPSVDRVMDANDMVEVFGPDSFDIVIAMEMMEHTPDWRKSLSSIKAVCKPGGLIIVTAPAPGYPYHGYPDDYWRYTMDDFRQMFQDCELIALKHDPTGPGTEICVRKPDAFVESALVDLSLHSMVAGRRIPALEAEHWKSKHFKKVRLQQFLANNGRRLFLQSGKKMKRWLKLN